MHHRRCRRAVRRPAGSPAAGGSRPAGVRNLAAPRNRLQVEALLAEAGGRDGIPEPVETYSSSPHLYTDLDIPEGTKGRLPRAARTREGLDAERLEDLGETGKSSGRRSGGGRGGMSTDDIRRAWPDVLDRIFRIKRVTWTLLSQNAQVAEFDGRLAERVECIAQEGDLTFFGEA